MTHRLLVCAIDLAIRTIESIVYISSRSITVQVRHEQQERHALRHNNRSISMSQWRFKGELKWWENEDIGFILPILRKICVRRENWIDAYPFNIETYKPLLMTTIFFSRATMSWSAYFFQVYRSMRIDDRYNHRWHHSSGNNRSNQPGDTPFIALIIKQAHTISNWKENTLFVECYVSSILNLKIS